MFVVIDGIDGSGKGTQTKLLVEKLQQMGKKVKLLDYPRYGHPATFAVEKYLNGGYGKDVSAKQASLFYALDRYDDSLELKEQMHDYDYIISNRYVSANMIHQGGKITDPQKRDEFLDWVYDFEFHILGIPKPDMTLFLSVSPEMSQKLVLAKQEREYITSGEKMDIHEADTQHLQNAAQTAEYLTSKYNDWHKITCEIDGNMRSIEDIQSDILNSLDLS